MKKLNTLNEELNRMKSLFGESRLYGNLVKEDTESCPPLDDDGCMVVTKSRLERSTVDGVLDIYKLFGFETEFEQKCGTPKMEIPKELLNSITKIKTFEHPSMFKSNDGAIEFCNKTFPNVTTIKKLTLFEEPSDLNKVFPKLKNIDDLYIDDGFEFFIDDGSYKFLSNISINNILANTPGYSKLTFNDSKDKTLVSKNVNNIDKEIVWRRGGRDREYYDKLLSFGWTEGEDDEGIMTYLTNPKGKSDDSVVTPKTEPTTTPSTPKEPKTTPTTKIEPDLISNVENEDVTWSDEDGTYKVGELEYLGIKNGLNTFKIKTDGRRVIGDPWQNKISEMYEENILSSLERMKNKYSLNYDPYGNIDVISKNKFTIK